MSKDKGQKNSKKAPADKSIAKKQSAYQSEKSNKIAITPLVAQVKKK